jgi:hypothetical protein
MGSHYTAPPVLGGATVLGVAFVRQGAQIITELPRTGGVALANVGAGLVGVGTTMTLLARRGRGGAVDAGTPLGN